MACQGKYCTLNSSKCLPGALGHQVEHTVVRVWAWHWILMVDCPVDAAVFIGCLLYAWAHAWGLWY